MRSTKKTRWLNSAILGLAVLAFTACENSPGKPPAGPEVMDPANVADFGFLYAQNCAGCHGTDGKGGAALALADPVYLAVVDDARLHSVSANGIPGTSMPAFAKSAGGMLTDKQIDIIAGGVRRWAKPNALNGAAPPPYAAAEPGNAAHGAGVYTAYCASCHGPAGNGGLKGSSIVDGSFLALLTDQELRTLVIVGRPELGAPDW
ncbi:MAG TPA: c-type cytochrome, partial [Candidatus Acidoferrales bacterium]|nr:c-type cytochrome [Candidatus Acidoferrales bacterium]